MPDETWSPALESELQTWICKPRKSAPSANVATISAWKRLRLAERRATRAEEKQKLETSMIAVFSAGSATGSEGAPAGGHETARTRTKPYAKKSVLNIIAQEARKMIIPTEE